MKKFVIVMIALLVLFIFLMLNYLLWDKENLQKQSASDKAQQDWLMGQNKTLQATIDQQEQTINTLNKDNSDYAAEVSNLQQQLEQANSSEYSLNNKLSLKDQVIAVYKPLMADNLKVLAQQWFDGITNQDAEGSFKMLADNCSLFGAGYNLETYTNYIKAIKSISFVKPTEGETQAGSDLEIIEGRGTDYEIYTVVTAEVVVADEQKDTYKDLAPGINRIQIDFRYDPDNKTWAIFSVLAANE